MTITSTFNKKDEILSLWRSLIEGSKHGFFQSESWISTWLELNKNNQELLFIYGIKNEQIQFGFFLGKQVNVKHKVIKARRGYVNNTGIVSLDEVTPEECMIVVRPEFQLESVNFNVFRNLKLDEIIVNAAFLDDLEAMTQLFKPKAKITVNQTYSYQVDLLPLKGLNSNYLNLLSKNTRSQLKRALKHTKELGELSIEVAKDATKAKNIFKKIKELHQIDSRRQSGAFNEAEFLCFHEKLIQTAFPKNEVILARVKIGENDLAYLYYFYYQNRVYFYQSGINYDFIPKFKPGYLAHMTAIIYFAKTEANIYDFLGSDYQYKSSLSTEKKKMIFVKLQGSTVITKIERLIRKLMGKKVEYLS